jgi:hypothetical protein
MACIGGSCTAPQNACKYSSECGDGKVCADGQCLASCETQQCAGGFKCDKGVCRPDVPSNPGGPTTPCTETSCGAGKYCNQGACVPDTRPKPNCTTDNECGGTTDTPKKCLGGFCKYTCSDSNHCLKIDNRIAYCAKDGVCRTESEANASCFGPGECGAGTCIDNQCR